MLAASRQVPWFPAAVLGVLVVAALFSPYLSPQDPMAGDITQKLIPPVWMERGTSEHPLGTEDDGAQSGRSVVRGAPRQGGAHIGLVGLDHHLDQFFESNLRLPAQLLLGAT